ncbi:aldo/keto reductase [Compostibacter hankyongensis]|uniref:Aldo/keto reductase n=1 Tax=Compostibacter hankyongensis TaxID=1007089 RepID=A0ABP8FQ78_9BACT
MEYRQIGSSDLKASVITFGAWAIGGWMWGGTDRKAAISAIRAALDEGVNTIDTAPVYGQGLSEELVKEALEGVPRERVLLLTKFGMRWDLEKGVLKMRSQDAAGKDIAVYQYAGRESVIKECEDSLRRLGTDYIDLYQQHWPDATTPIAETMEAVQRLIEQGKVRAAGVCNYSADQMREAEQTLPLASNQVPYSMVLRDIEKAVVPYCLEHGKGILVYSPLQRGVLTGKFSPEHVFENDDHRSGMRYYQPENIRRINAFLEKLRPLAEEKKASIAQLVIRWTIAQPGITVALVGARDARQAQENARAAAIRLSEEELQLISRELEALRLA